MNLGPAYGTVRVIGMTIEEAQRAIKAKLMNILREPEVSVQLARASGMQPITGPYLVGPDGTVNLRQYGAVYVAGKTLTEAKLALEQQLSACVDSPEVSVDIASYNSKVYYIITEGGGQGDNVVRLPVTGNETVLDAISQIQGLSQLSSKSIWIARPSPAGLRLRAGPAGRLGRDHPRRHDRDELPNHAGRPGVHRGRPDDRADHHDQQNDRTVRASAGLQLADVLDRPQRPVDGRPDEHTASRWHPD